jgi:hypothetical protein
MEMVGKTSGIRMGAGATLKSRIRQRALAALRGSNLSEVCSECGIEGNFDSAGAALKTVLAERSAEHIMRALEVAKRNKTKFGAAAIVIAAQG